MDSKASNGAWAEQPKSLMNMLEAKDRAARSREAAEAP
jgi:hypothetical protein